MYGAGGEAVVTACSRMGPAATRGGYYNAMALKGAPLPGMSLASTSVSRSK